MTGRAGGTTLVSVVMSVYDCAAYVGHAVGSVLAQTFDDFELLVVDDGSADGSYDVVMGAAGGDGRVSVHRNPRNLGLVASLNDAIGAASGAYVMRVDADDWCHPARLERQLDLMRRSPGLGALSCFVECEFADGVRDRDREGIVAFEERRRRLWREGADLRVALATANVFYHGEVLMRRDVWERAGGYRHEFPMAEDYDLWLRMAELADLAILPEVLYFRRVLPQG